MRNGDLILPVVSQAFGGLDFSSYYLALAGQPAGLPLAEAFCGVWPWAEANIDRIAASRAAFDARKA